MLFYNHKAYSENIYKFLDFSTQSHLLIFQVCCFTEGGGGSVGQKMKREHDLTFLNAIFLFLFYISFIFKKVILKFYRKFPLIFYISTFIWVSNSCSGAFLFFSTFSLFLTLYHTVCVCTFLSQAHSLMFFLCFVVDIVFYLPEYTKLIN